MDDLTTGDDGFARCPWGASSPEYRAYHDDEWGRPQGAEERVYEKLCLEGFQAGLSWITVLRKREAFREVFAGFDPAKVAAYDESDVERLLGDARIIRHRGKIEATIKNAHATVALWDAGMSLAGLVWQHAPAGVPAHHQLGELPATTADAKALSKELRRRGFAFVGPTTTYAAMQALGVVNDHLEGCHWREVVEEDRKRFVVPGLERD